MPERGTKKGYRTCWVCSQKYWWKDSGHKKLCPSCISEKSQCVVCGNEMPKFTRKNGELRRYCSRSCQSSMLYFIPGMRERLAEKKSVAMRNRWAGEDYKKKHAEAMRDVYSDEVWLQKRSEIMQQRWQDEEYRNSMSNMTRELWNGDHYRSKQKQILSDRWNNEGYREMQIRMATEMWQTQEHREKMKVSMARVFESEEYREKMRDIVKERWDSGFYDDKITSFRERTLMGIRSGLEKIVEAILVLLNIDYEFNYKVGRYWLDFALVKWKIDLECDSKYWHAGREKQEAKRDKFLADKGWIVVRLNENEIEHDLDNALSRKLIPLLI